MKLKHLLLFFLSLVCIHLQAAVSDSQYQVIYLGNGATSGSMSASTFDIGVNETSTLSQNQFKRSYVVSFDVDGGTAIAPKTCNYTFSGWLQDTLLTSTTNDMATNWFNISTSQGSSTDLKLLTLSYVDNENNITAKPKAGVRERLYSKPIYMPAGNYGLKFKFCSPSGYSNLVENNWLVAFKLAACNMPQDVYCNDQGLITTATDTSAVLLENYSASTTLVDRDFTIYADGTTPVYLTINCGNIYDGSTYTFKFADYVLSINGKTYLTYTDKASTSNLVREASGTVNLKAQWTPASVTLPLPVKAGYTFLGWNTKSNGTGDSYKAGEKYTPTADQTLYAMWKPKISDGEYTVVYDGNGATSGSMDKHVYKIGVDETTLLDANAYQLDYTVSYDVDGGTAISPVKVNYKFNGWLHDTLLTEVTNNMENWNNVTTNNSTGRVSDTCIIVKYENGVNLITANTLYNTRERFYSRAFYVPAGNYNLTFKFCSPTGYASLQSNWESLFKMSACNIPQATSGSDEGRFTSGTNKSAVVLEGNSASDVLEDRSLTIYAKDETPVYLATNYGNVEDLTHNQFKYADLVLSINGKSYLIYEDEAPTINLVREDGGIVNLKAQWEPVSITLPLPVKAGYTFLGWNTSSNGTGTTYNAGDTFTPSADVTLYAMWLNENIVYPDNIIDVDCTILPDSSAFDVEEKFTVKGAHSMTAPLVGDIDGDGDPEILVQLPCNYSNSTSYVYTQNIMVVDGKTQKTKYTIKTPQCDIYGTKLTFGDVNNDGKAEIFIQDEKHYVYAYTYNGTEIWKYPTKLDHSHQLSLADINGDGTAELIVGHYIFDAQTGTLLLNGTMTSTGTGYCSPHTLDHMPYASWSGFDLAFHVYGLYDFDNDGQLELCAGNTLYKINITNNSGTSGNTWSVLRQMPANDDIPTLDGETIVGDFDNDGDADVIVVALPDNSDANKTVYFYVWDGQTDQLICHAETEKTDHGVSLPFAGDLNGDGKMEVAVNRPSGFYEFAYDENEAGNVKLLAYNLNKFSETTSFTAFDFNQDGKDELVYHDMTKISICDGVTYEDRCTPVTAYSGTMMEFPVVADVDGDGHAEILFNRAFTAWSSSLNNYSGELVVLGSKKPGAWSSARKVWNQYPYNVVNINEDLTIPTQQFDLVTKFANGKKPFNAVQKQLPYMDKKGNLFNVAPDLTIVADSGHVVTYNCTTISIDSLFIKNQGDIQSLDSLNFRITDVTTNTVISDTTIADAAIAKDSVKLFNLTVKTNVNPVGDILVEINSNTNKQPECVYSNNSISLQVPAFTNHTTVFDTVCYVYDDAVNAGNLYYDTKDTALLTSFSGCDSSVVTITHYQPSYIFSETHTMMEEETSYTWRGKVLTDNGVYYDSLLTKAGCDSVYKLILIKYTYPDNIVDANCTVAPDASAFDIEEKFAIRGAHSMSAVLVGDIDGDGHPEILAAKTPSTYNGFVSVTGIMVIDGVTQKLKYTISTPNYNVYGVKYTFADVDHDGKAEIFLQPDNKKIYCYSYDGQLKWTSATALDNFYQLSAADVNADGTAELVVGHYIFDAQTGTLLLNGTMTTNGTGFCSPHAIHLIGIEAFHMYGLYDFDKDGQLEMCAGNALYKMNITNNAGTTGNSWELLREMPSNANVPYLDGETVVADFDNDGDADVIVIGMYQGGSATDVNRKANIYVWDGQTTDLIAYADVPAAEYGISAPFCGDINNDGLIELAVCRSNGMTVVNYDATATSHINFLTKQNSKFKETSSFTAFDFNQDGRDEFVYRDDNYLSISDGKTFTDLCTPINAYSGTVAEFPVVADVDADGHAEIIITRSPIAWDGNGNIEKITGDVVVYGSKKPGAWSSARKVWNQYPYNVVNINEDLTVPARQFDLVTVFPNGKKPFNAVQKQFPYMNKQGELFNVAPDLIIVPDTGLAVTSNCKGFVIDSLFVTNLGDGPSLKDLTVKVTDVTTGNEIFSDTLTNKAVEVKDTIMLNLDIQVTTLPAGDILVEINPDDEARQGECNYTNNSITLQVPAFVPSQYIVKDTVCYLYDAATAVNATGYYDDTVTTKLTDIHGCDSLVIKYTHYKPSFVFDETYTICSGETYTWHNQSLNVTGTYRDTLVSMAGCDSIVTLNLTVNPTYHFDESYTICSGETYTWHSKTLTETGTYYDSLKTVNGCDSIYTLQLTVNPSYDLKFNKTICEGETYTWEGETLSEAGTYTKNLMTQAGCDSIRTLVLTVNPIMHTELNENICDNDTYTFKGVALNITGTYRDTLVSMAGCDSIVTLNLTVNPTYHFDESYTICSGETYTWHSKTLTETGTYYDSLKTVNGCDSIYTLQLTVNPSYNLKFNKTICEGETYTWEGETLSEAGTYTKNLMTQAGCDSIRSLVLTVNPILRTSVNETICEGDAYQLGDTLIADAGTYVRTLTAITGCDSIVTLTLTVEHPQTVNMSETICEGITYTFGDQSKTYEAGDHTLKVVDTGINGCDSTTILNLKVNPASYIQLYDTIYCGDAYSRYGFDIQGESHKGNYTYTLTDTNIYGCDSTVTLNLTVKVFIDNTEIPTAFSPSNEDGVNDVFMSGYEVYIYDRYGNLICHSEQGWNGRYRGTYADPGVYIYAIKMKDGKMKKGTIEVLKN